MSQEIPGESFINPNSMFNSRTEDTEHFLSSGGCDALPMPGLVWSRVRMSWIRIISAAVQCYLLVNSAGDNINKRSPN